MGKYVMALDAGTTSNRCILFDREGEHGAAWLRRNLPSIFRSPAGWSMTRGRSGPRMLGVAVEAMQKAGADGCGYRGHRHHKPERDDHRLGQKYRRAGLPRHCLAVPENLEIL